MPVAPLPTLPVNYELAGTGRSIVLVHSWGTSLRVWDDVAADLRRDHRVLAFDSRGCGLSGRPATGHTIQQNARDVLALIDHLGLSAPILVGSSVGGLFAYEAARLEPEAVAGLVLVDAPGYWAKAMAPSLLAHHRALQGSRPDLLAASARSMYSAAAPPELAEHTSRLLQQADPAIDALFIEQSTYDPRPAVAELGLPALYLHGAADRAVPVAVAHEMAGHHRSPAPVVVVEGAGHMPHQEAPGQVAAAIRGFSTLTGGEAR